MLIMVLLLLSSCVNNPTTTYATRDVEVVFGEEQTYPRIALVIGNNDYERNKKLINAVPDARAMRDFFEKKNFKVVYTENANKDTMNSKINEFMGGLGKKSVAVVYYAGHASQDKSRTTGVITNYLVPVNDNTLTSITDYDRDAIPLNYILNKADELNHGLNIAMLDACRTPIGRGGNIQNIGAEGVYLVYSTASGTTASDSGAFRRSFLKYAEQPLKLTDIFGNVKMDLRKEGQRPSIQDDAVGMFYFSKPKPVVVPTPTNPQAIESVSQQPTSKWITPKDSVCKANGGEIDKYGVCKAKWEEAKQICRASGGSLPTKEVLGQVVSDCGGILGNWWIKENASLESLFDSSGLTEDSAKNIKNSNYQSCYKSKGFNSNDYWSSTTNVTNTNNAWYVSFHYGYQNNYTKDNSSYVRCVRVGQ